MYCPKCGLNNDEDAKYCEKCGTLIKKNTKTGEEHTGTSVKYLIVICVILVAGLGIVAGYILQ